MRNKTNFTAIKDLMDKYKPARMGIVSAAETAMIRDALEIAGRNDLELDDVRDAVVMLYGQTAQQIEQDQGVQALMEHMDAMSAITAAIDAEKASRSVPGAEVKTYPEQPMYAVSADSGTTFLTSSAKAPFQADPACARKWQSPADAMAMAGYAATAHGKPDAGVVRVETVTTVFPLASGNGIGGAHEPEQP